MATQIQATVSGALQELGFEADDGMPGAPQRLKATAATAARVQELVDNDGAVVVDGDGNLTFE